MFDIRDLYRTLTGRELSGPDEQRLLASAAKANIPNDDPMFALLVVLEANFGILRDFTAEAAFAARDGAEAAAKAAGSLAEARIVQAVDHMLPTLSQKVAQAAAKATSEAIQPVRRRASLIFIVAFSCIVSIAMLAAMSTTLLIVYRGDSSRALGPMKWSEISIALGAGCGLPLLTGLGLLWTAFGESYLVVLIGGIIVSGGLASMMFLFVVPLFAAY